MTSTEVDRDRARNRRRLLSIQLCLWFVAIAFLLFTPNRLRPLFGAGQIAAHLILFSLLGLVTFSVLRSRTWSLLGLATLAVGSEIAQHLLDTGHRGEAVDVLVNFCGIAIGVAAGSAISRLPQSHALRLALFASTAALALLGGLLVISSPSFNRVANCLGSTKNQPDLQLSDRPDPTIRVSADALVFVNGDSSPFTSPIALEDATEPLCQAIGSNEFTLIATVQSADNDQSGPTRIVSSSISTDPKEVNFHLGQEAKALSIRLRFAADNTILWEQVPDVFTDDEPKQVAIRFSGNDLTLFVDGKQRETYDVPSGTIAYWDKNYPFLVGDEMTGGRKFIGVIGEVLFFSDALDDDAIAELSESQDS